MLAIDPAVREQIHVEELDGLSNQEHVEEIANHQLRPYLDLKYRNDSQEGLPKDGYFAQVMQVQFT